MGHRILGVCGMPGARKSDASSILVGHLGATSFSMSKVVRAELLKEGKEPTPDAYSSTGKFLREKGGEDWLARQTLLHLAPTSPLCVVDGLRTPAEVSYFREHAEFFRLLNVHASRETRFARMRSRSGPELQHDADLMAQDSADLLLGMGEVIALADYVAIVGSYARVPFQVEICRIGELVMAEMSRPLFSES